MIPSLMIVLLLTWFFRIKRKALLQYQYEYKLANLRDNLRWMAINNEIDDNNWLYKYVDNNLTITKKNLKEINIYSAIGLNLLHRKDKKFYKFKTIYEEEISQKANKKIQQISNAFLEELVMYILKKHVFFKYFVLMFSLVRNHKKNKNSPPTKTEKKIWNFGFFPETSASRDYLPC